MAKRISKFDAATSETATGKGERSRTAILTAAARLATTYGLHGLSIGDLATHLGMSKSGLYAHFKSKEELELATIEAAAAIFNREVLEPAMAAPPGVRRLRKLVDAFLSHLERRVFPGGCFFAAVAAELDTRPGLTRDRIAQVLRDWLALLTSCFEDAKSNGEIARRADVPQSVFETESMLLGANFLFVMTEDATPLTQARKGIDNLVARLAGKRD
jgi:AcrR family transcriptional regulator